MTVKPFKHAMHPSMFPNSPVVSDKLPLIQYSVFQCRHDFMEIVGKSTLTGRHQLTLPKNVRKFLSADNGDLIVFIKDQDTIQVKRGIVKVED